MPTPSLHLVASLCGPPSDVNGLQTSARGYFTDGGPYNSLHWDYRKECTRVRRPVEPTQQQFSRTSWLTGPKDKPLHVSLFPPHLESRLDFSFLLNSCLDIFEIRQKQTSVDQDLGLLHAVDERLAAYGWLTNTGVKFLIIVDMAGCPTTTDSEKRKGTAVAGLRDSDLKPVCTAGPCSFVLIHTNVSSLGLGVPSSANRLHPASAESFLCPRRPRLYCESHPSSVMFSANHKPGVYFRSQANRGLLGSRPG